MSDFTRHPTPLLNGWRIAGWGSLLALLALPVLAMQFTGEVDWTGGDFAFAAILLSFLGMSVETGLRVGKTASHRAGYVIAAGTAFATVWSNAAVGIIGDDNAVNGLFFVMVAMALVAGLIRRFRPRTMGWITCLLALGQYGTGLIAMYALPGHPIEWGILTFLAALWICASACFWRKEIPLLSAR